LGEELKNKTGAAKGAAKEHLGKATDEQMGREGRSEQTKSNPKQVEKVKDASTRTDPDPTGPQGAVATVLGRCRR